MHSANYGVSHTWELMTFLKVKWVLESGSEEGLLGLLRGDVLPYLKLLSAFPHSL